jgi:hypothetical protein
MGSIEVEMMKPAIITMSPDIDTIAVFKRDLYQSDKKTFKYFKSVYHDSITDPAIQYRDLSNKCVDAMAHFLEKEGYFLKVINYRDSMNVLFTVSNSQIYYPELLTKFKVDACIFLDYFYLDDYLKNHYSHSDVYNETSSFPEFKKSTQLEHVDANLLWTIIIKGDSVRYTCKQPDDLYYGNSVNPEFFGDSLKHKLLIENTSVYLGNSFGKKLLPSMLNVFRTYYQSHNVKMLQAEQYLVNGDWMKAAEIYKVQTNNKNRNIAAKAKYNMGLICEMEGNIDAAFDWLVKSYSAYNIQNPDHELNCKQYVDLLATRRKELERLKNQIRDNGEN